MPTFNEFLGKKKPTGVAWDAYGAWAKYLFDRGGVRVDSLGSSYYARHWAGARRVSNQNVNRSDAL